MRKIAELSGDEFFDVIYALSPVLPMIADMEVVQAQLFGNYSAEVKSARASIALNTTLLKNGGNPDKEEEYKQKIKAANLAIESEISGIFARDITKIVPQLVSKENRSCIFETLSIIDGLPIDEIKKYIPPKLISKIKSVISDTDFKSFLSYAEESEPTK